MFFKDAVKWFVSVSFVLFVFVSTAAVAATTTRESVGTAGLQASGGNGSVSSDGRYVAFESSSNNLVPNDTNANTDVFVHDRTTNVTTRVSVATGGVQGSYGGYQPSISNDGRYVAFTSRSSLVSGVTGIQVYVHDTWTSTTVLASRSTAGVTGSGASDVPAISGNGRYVAFNSVAANLVTGDTNGRIDTFVRDLVANTTTRVSVTNAGGQALTTALIGNRPAISDDGRYVAFQSYATNLVAGDTNAAPDIFVRDRVGNTTRRVSVTNAGGQGNGWSYEVAISGDGRYVAFSSAATNLVAGDTNARRDIFVRDRVGNTTTRMSVTSGGVQGNGDSSNPAINLNGRYVAFTSSATNLVSGDTNAASDVFVRDRTGLTTTRVSTSSANAQADNYSYANDINGAGNMVLFSSDASNLVSGDTNGVGDVFLNVR